MKYALDQAFIEEVRLRSDIVQFISEYVPLQKKGKNYVGLCPFHSEKTPSFTVTPDKQIFYCFGCQTGGNIFTFLMKQENISFVEAVKKVAEKVGMPLPTVEQTPETKRKFQERETFLQLNQLAAQFFHQHLLRGQAGKQAFEYLNQRGITEQTMLKFMLGYAPPIWDGLLRYLTQKGYHAELLSKLGLVLPRRQGGGYYDRFRDRIIFPIFDVQGRIIGFGGRVLDGSQPKYLNSSESPLFHKSRSLYGINYAVEAIRQQGKVIIVEGYMDAISLHQAGVSNVVASLGTSFTRNQAIMLLKYTQDILIAYDSDTAGKSATLRGLKILSELGGRVRIIALPSGKDPDEFIQKHGKQAFEELCEQAMDIVDYHLTRAMEQHDLATVEGKIEVIQRLKPFLLNLDNAIEFDTAVRKIADQLKVTVEAVKFELKKDKTPIMRDNRHNSAGTHHNNSSARILDNSRSNELAAAYVVAQQELLKMMVEDSAICELVREQLAPEDFTVPEYQELYTNLLQLREINPSPSGPDVLAYFTDTKIISVLTKLLMQTKQVNDRNKLVQDYIMTIKLHRLEREIEASKIRAQQLDAQGDLQQLHAELIKQTQLITLKNELKKQL